MIRPRRAHRCFAVLASLALFSCAAPSRRVASPSQPLAHHPLLHYVDTGRLDLFVYDDGEVSGTDLRSRTNTKLGQLSAAIADDLRAETVHLPASLPLEPLGSETKGITSICHDESPILFSAFTPSGTEVTVRKYQRCRDYVARTPDARLGATLVRFVDILRGWEAAAQNQP